MIKGGIYVWSTSWGRYFSLLRTVIEQMFGTSNKYIPHKSPPLNPPPILNPQSFLIPLNPIPTYLISSYIILQSSSIVHQSFTYHPTPPPYFSQYYSHTPYTPILPYISPKTHTTFKLYLSPKRVFCHKMLTITYWQILKTII